METHARHVLVGLFTLAVTAAGFVFVYWLNTTGGLGERTVYRIRYENSVAGLLEGSAVLFNGVRVGEVTALDLDPEKPQDIVVTIAVEPETPVRTDTNVGIEFQGLTGSPAVSLSGGSAARLGPYAASGEPSLLVADPAAGQSMSGAARDALRRIDALVADNSEQLGNTISNLSKFSDALGRNSDRVDGIIAGLERLTGGGSKAQAPAFDLTAPKTFPAFEKPAAVQLIVAEPTASFALSQDKILMREAGGLKPLSPDAKWSDMLPNLFQARVIQSFENAGFLNEVSRPIDGLPEGIRLILDMRCFEGAGAPAPAAEVEFSAKVLAADGRILNARLFRASVPAKGSDAAAVASALDAAFVNTASDLVVWTSAAIRGAS